MTLLKVAAWIGMLGLGAWAGAVPVKVANANTGQVWITDKATGEAVYMAADVLRYSVHGKVKWEKKAKNFALSSKGNYFIDALLGQDRIFIAAPQGKENFQILSLFKNGKLEKKMQANAQYSYHFELKNYWPINRVIDYMECHDGAIIQCGYYILNTKMSENLAQWGQIMGESKGLLYLQTDDLTGGTDLDLRYKLITEGVQKISYKIYTLNSKLIPSAFYTPPRKDCGDYQPKIEDLANANGLTKPEYAANIVKGEYIYAHRADGCGKFTYKFHWTDPRNPAPQTLQGWQ